MSLAELDIFDGCSIVFSGDVRLALAGYNAGEGAVEFYGYRIPPISRNPKLRSYYLFALQQYTTLVLFPPRLQLKQSNSRTTGRKEPQL
jgi:hypothetical protein